MEEWYSKKGVEESIEVSMNQFGDAGEWTRRAEVVECR